MIVLFTDFGLAGPYTGQVKAVLYRAAPDVPVVDLFADAPTRDPRAAAYLLAAYAGEFPPGTVFLAVVDPGVGSARRAAVVLADDRWYVGPDNGLFELVVRRAAAPPRWWPVTRRPSRLSPTFHGRDLFAPVAAGLACGGTPDEREQPIDAVRRADWPDDLAEIVYVDVFGNAMTGVRAAVVPPTAVVTVAGRRLSRARTFSEVSPGQAFWYENANGLLEIAVNMGRADEALDLAPGCPVSIEGI
ncbi:MAG: S-adenosyl-l-methionine hydroxide adenosyltransferase family protein [Rhodospirillales bacterium]